MRFATRGGRLALFLCSALAVPAAAQDYPASSDTSTLVAWLGESTNIAPETVVSVTPELVVAIVGKTPPASPGGPVRLTLRQEVIASGYVQAVGGRSSLMSMAIQCEERRVRMDERRLYAGLNLTGSVETTPPSAAWVRIPEGSIMDEVARAACDADYPWPLRALEAKPQVTASIAPAPPGAPVLPSPPEPEPAPVAAPEPAPEPEPPAPEPASEPAETAVREPAPEPAETAAAEPAPEPSEPAAPEADIEPPAPAPALETTESPVAPEPPQEQTPPPTGPFFAAQIGAFDSSDDAEAAWAALTANRPVLVEGLRFDIRPVTVRGRDWLRGLVRGFATRQDAAAFCTALAGTEHGCILRKLAD